MGSVILLFGRSNAVIALVFLLYTQTMVKNCLSIVNMLLDALWLVGYAILGTLVSMHFATLIIFGFILIFFLIYADANEFLKTNYYIPGMAFILMQISPGTLAALPIRILALLYCLAVCTGITLLLQKRQKTPAVDPLIQEALACAGTGFKLLGQKIKKEDEAIDKKLDALSQKLSSNIYPAVFRQMGLMNGRQKYTYGLMLCLEQLGQVLQAIGAASQELPTSDQAQFSVLGDRMEKAEDPQLLAADLQAFLKRPSLTENRLNRELLLILETLRDRLLDDSHRTDLNTSIKEGLRYKSFSLRRRFSLDFFQMRFALQTAVIVTACTAVAHYIPYWFNIPLNEWHGYWIPLMGYLSASIYIRDTLRKAAFKVTGTILGMIFFVLVTQYIPASIRLPLTVAIGLVFMLTIKSSIVSTMISTQMTSVMFLPQLGVMDLVLFRVFCVIGGVSIAVLGGIFIFRTRKQDVFRYELTSLFKSDLFILYNLWNLAEKQEAGPLLYENLLNLHLVGGQLESLSGQQKLVPAKVFEKIMNKNRHFLAVAVHLSMYLSVKGISPKQWQHVKDEIHEAGETLQKTFDTTKNNTEKSSQG
ncbi:FUSC family protein [Eubacterium sp. 1001713B170207_170306_E7]|uniref:FUSC family protein n=1 Tax=Eubacterium sp. 1001713B170207_170306_E7 TaxID=2787097 RepID=UPI001899E1B3|nr:FUSC family protein [Eubacterium sp. 1001713B170207_170306_E7]